MIGGPEGNSDHSTETFEAFKRGSRVPRSLRMRRTPNFWYPMRTVSAFLQPTEPEMQKSVIHPAR